MSVANMKLKIMYYIILGMVVLMNHSTATEVKENIRPIIPVKYDLDFYTEIGNKEPHFSGVVRIMFICKGETKEITVDQESLNIKDSSVEVKVLADNYNPESVLPIQRKTPYPPNGVYSIYMEEDLKSGKFYEVKMEFSKTFNKDEVGYIAQVYRRKPGVLKAMAFTNLRKIDAKRVFPCFNQIDLKARFKIRSHHHKDFKGFSNGLSLMTQPDDHLPDWEVDDFEETVPLAPHSVAMAVMDFAKKEIKDPSMKIAIRIWSDEALQKDMSYMNEIVYMSFQFFDDYFGKSCELKKLDVLVQSVEQDLYIQSYGLIIMSTDLTLTSPETVRLDHNYKKVLEICQVISMQWIGQMVTVSQWSESWLHMGLITYLQTLCARDLFPKWEFDILLQKKVESYIFLLQWKPKENLHMIWDLNFDLYSIAPEFLENVVLKTEYLFRMLNFALGSELFRLSVNTYIKTFKYGNPNLKQFWNSFQKTVDGEEILHSSVEKIVKPFFTESEYPVIKAAWKPEKGILKLRQKTNQYLKGESELNKDWIIPIRFITKENPISDHSNCLWLDSEKPLKVNLKLNPGDWYLLNLGQNVLAYVNYDTNNWALIRNTLLDVKEYALIDISSRTRLITDIFALAEIGKLPYVFVFDTMKYLLHEDSLMPWSVAFHEFNRIKSHLYDTKFLEPFKIYVRSILLPLYELLEIKSSADLDQSGDKSFRTSIIVWSYKFELAPCQEVIQNYSLNLGAPRGSNRLSELSLCEYVKKNDLQECNNLLWKLRDDAYDGNKSDIMVALPCSSNTDCLNGFLQWILFDKHSLLPKERLNIIHNFSQRLDRGTYILLTDYFKENYDSIEYNLGEEVVLGYADILFDMTSQKNDLEQLTEFLKAKTLPGNTEPTIPFEMFEKSRKKAERNILWLEKNKDSLKYYFNVGNTPLQLWSRF